MASFLLSKGSENEALGLSPQRAFDVGVIRAAQFSTTANASSCNQARFHLAVDEAPEHKEHRQRREYHLSFETCTAFSAN
jgi:hypothetical protein